MLKRQNKIMKHVKLFEGYDSEEEAPFSITIELTDALKNIQNNPKIQTELEDTLQWPHLLL
jgi:hypothetical protein